jgi:hypothetical protein
MYSRNTPPVPGDRANRISFYVFNPDGGRGCGSYFQDPITVGRWIHIVGVIDPMTEQTIIYKNGELRNSNSYQGKIVPVTGPAHLRLGSKNLKSFFRGAIGPARIWNRPLSPSEVHDLYVANAIPAGLVAEYPMSEGRGSVVHDSVGGHDGEVHAAAWGMEPRSIQESTGPQGGGC